MTLKIYIEYHQLEAHEVNETIHTEGVRQTYLLLKLTGDGTINNVHKALTQPHNKAVGSLTIWAQTSGILNYEPIWLCLTQRGRVTYTLVSHLWHYDSNYGLLLPVWHQTSIWTIFFYIEPFGTHFCEIWTKIQQCSSMKMNFGESSISRIASLPALHMSQLLLYVYIYISSIYHMYIIWRIKYLVWFDFKMPYAK